MVHLRFVTVFFVEHVKPIVNILATALSLLSPLSQTMNPKAVTSDELFGWKTDEWHDGVLSVIMRDMARNNPPYTPNQV